MKIKERIIYIEKKTEKIQEDVDVLKKEQLSLNNLVPKNISSFANEMKKIQKKQSQELFKLNLLQERNQEDYKTFRAEQREDYRAMRATMEDMSKSIINYIKSSKDLNSKLEIITNKTIKNEKNFRNLKNKLIPGLVIIIVIATALPATSKKIYDIINKDIIKKIIRGG